MPCDSSYLNADPQEQYLSRVHCLLEELDGKATIEPSHWRGYHPKVYNKHISREEADALVATLCARLQATDVTRYSLEMQIWWRDHQRADKARIERDLKKAKDATARKAALAKLTPYERKLLRVEDK